MNPLFTPTRLLLFLMPFLFYALHGSASPRKQAQPRKPASSQSQTAVPTSTVPSQQPQAGSAPLFNAPTALSAAPSAGSRSNSLTFEDEVISGMNRNPLDSLTQIGKGDNHNQNRLYRKKEHFKLELIYSIRETGLVR